MSNKDPIRVMVVEDHELVRKGIRYSLSVFDDIELVAETDNGTEALRLCEEFYPDVVLMDLKMPDPDGVTTTRAIRQRWPHIQVIALTSFDDSQYVKDALQAGAVSYLLKTVRIEDLADAIRKARVGRSSLSPAAAGALAEEAAKTSALGRDLTERERQVLELIVQGSSNADIAHQLSVSLSTARFYVSAILSKLNASNRAEAAALAVKHHLLP